MHNILLEITLHFVARVGDMVDQHLLELVEDLTLVAAEANEGEDILQGGRGSFVTNTSLELRETVRVECDKNILENERINKQIYSYTTQSNTYLPGKFKLRNRHIPHHIRSNLQSRVIRSMEAHSLLISEV